MDFINRHKSKLAFVLLTLPSGIAGILYLIERFTEVKITITTLSVFWFTFPLAIIGFVLFLQGRKSVELVDIGIDGTEFGVSGINGYPELDSKRILKMDIHLNAIPRKRVDTIRLDIANNLIPPDWQPDYIPMQVSTNGVYYFNIPDSVKPDKYTSRLVISLESKSVKSKQFEIEVPI